MVDVFSKEEEQIDDHQKFISIPRGTGTHLFQTADLPLDAGVIAVMFFGIIDQSADTFQNGVQGNFDAVKVSSSFICQRSVFFVLLAESSCPVPQTGEPESENTVPIRHRVVKVGPNGCQPGFLLLPPKIGDGIFQILFIYSSIVVADERSDRAFFPVITAESGETVMGVYIDLHISANKFKTMSFDHGNRLLFPSGDCVQNFCSDFIICKSGCRIHDRGAEFIDQIFSVIIKTLIKHDFSP